MLDLTTPRPWQLGYGGEEKDGEREIKIVQTETGNTILRMGDPFLDDSCPENVNVADAELILKGVAMADERTKFLENVELALHVGVKVVRTDIPEEFTVNKVVDVTDAAGKTERTETPVYRINKALDGQWRAFYLSSGMQVKWAHGQGPTFSLAATARQLCQRLAFV